VAKAFVEMLKIASPAWTLKNERPIILGPKIAENWLFATKRLIISETYSHYEGSPNHFILCFMLLLSSPAIMQSN